MRQSIEKRYLMSSWIWQKVDSVNWHSAVYDKSRQGEMN